MEKNREGDRVSREGKGKMVEIKRVSDRLRIAVLLVREDIVNVISADSPCWAIRSMKRKCLGENLKQ